MIRPRRGDCPDCGTRLDGGLCADCGRTHVVEDGEVPE